MSKPGIGEITNEAKNINPNIDMHKSISSVPSGPKLHFIYDNLYFFFQNFWNRPIFPFYTEITLID